MLRKKDKKYKEKKIPIIRLGTNKKSVIVLWIVLIVSIAFGVYKNFTAIDKHTIHEKEVIEQKIIDTNGVENFVKNFAKEYYSWENNKESIERRTSKINEYLTKELQELNRDTVRNDIPTSSSVKNVQIWSVNQIKENEFEVKYSVEQTIKEGEETKYIISSYEVVVKIDNTGNMIIIKNPTLSKMPEKLNYESKNEETDSTIDQKTIKDITEFLNTFFKLYPTASKNELEYYVKGDALKPINGDYIFSELVNPIFKKEGKNIKVSTGVKYIDQQTKMIQVSQYKLTLEKDNNWIIVK
ncbi:conjugative transposon TcpC family protein [Clostridioides difficile CD149]|uniref:Conjugative transposon protein n=1 Tax=Clostridioides difficile TaxID=1496 RepID=A0AB74QD03_CLODI|nr:conjugal transfer protein [Clostridioides difficile]OFU33413.1 conjugal transfer protein [Clostridium sp. HMSC19B12]AXU26432.1 conjugative transposon protein [Clostridioides difficile]AXU30292.1 conjugative transposon protein [Clostridioides difficile]AXU34080.1 conjugative transposon protein [Clostridioides difficile]EGT3654793.1 conjugal transfer protein [Clostridioides difficile]